MWGIGVVHVGYPTSCQFVAVVQKLEWVQRGIADGHVIAVNSTELSLLGFKVHLWVIRLLHGLGIGSFAKG